jgi:group II intron reverse transcriptase/maturase
MNRDGHKEVVDADLSGYFDTIPHPELMKSLARRIADKAVLHLIKMWLEAPVEETDKKTGRTTGTTVNKDTKRGSPQGSPISPLLSNLYMRRFILAWKKRGYDKRFGGRIVNYADDLVICCQRDGEKALEAMREIMVALKLTVNEDKTRVCHMPKDSFVFLGYEFCKIYSWKKKKMYLGCRPAKKAIGKLTESITEITAANNGWKEISNVVRAINRKLSGWAGYFSTGSVTKAYKIVSKHTIGRLRHWLGRKHKWKTKRYKDLPDGRLYEQSGLVNLMSRLPGYP